jgi:protein-tyrosine kinase
MSIVQKALEKMQKTAAGTAATHAAIPPPPPPAWVERGDVRRPQRSVITFDRVQLRAVGMLPAEGEDRRLAEEFRRIKRPLVDRAQGSAADSNDRVIVVTSAMPGEGKTFTAFNLAFNLALERDNAVLLIDGDVPKPQITTLMGLRGRPGLVDALLDSALDVEAAVVDTDVPNLAVLSAGSRTEAAPELFASRRMTEIMQTLKAADPHRLIVIDSPPLLWTADSRELAAVAGQIVLVVRAGETPHQAVYDAIDSLGEGRHVSLVLNQADLSSLEGSYYGYGRYGLGADPTAVPAAASAPARR